MLLCLRRISWLTRYVKLNLNLSEHSILTQNQAYQRIKSRKSLLASGILDSIKKFFASAEFAARPDKIREYVLWALRPGGPAYYGIPTPQEYRVKPDNPNYKVVCPAPPHWRDCWLEDCILQHPGAFLESKFIKPFAEKYLTYAAQSILTPALDRKHPPKGLYALILVAVCSSIFSLDIIGNNDCFF